jgi:hypothetical protein
MSAAAVGTVFYHTREKWKQIPAGGNVCDNISVTPQRYPMATFLVASCIN